MRKRSLLLCLGLATLTGALRQLSADTITLIGGERIEGKITNETAADVTIEYKSGGVTDVRTVPRNQIQKLEKDTPDETDFRPLKNAKPGPNWLRVDEY